MTSTLCSGKAERVKATIADVPGVTPPVVEAQQLTSEVHVRLRGADLAFHGLTRDEVATVVKTALQGEEVSQVVDGRKRFDLLVRLDEPFRTDLPKFPVNCGSSGRGRQTGAARGGGRHR